MSIGVLAARRLVENTPNWAVASRATRRTVARCRGMDCRPRRTLKAQSDVARDRLALDVRDLDLEAHT